MAFLFISENVFDQWDVQPQPNPIYNAEATILPASCKLWK